MKIDGSGLRAKLATGHWKRATCVRWPSGHSIVRILDRRTAWGVASEFELPSVFEREFYREALLFDPNGTPIARITLPIGHPVEIRECPIAGLTRSKWKRICRALISGLWVSSGFRREFDGILGYLDCPLDDPAWAERLAKDLARVAAARDPSHEKRVDPWRPEVERPDWEHFLRVDGAIIQIDWIRPTGCFESHRSVTLTVFPTKASFFQGRCCVHDLTGKGSGESDASDPLPALKQAGIVVDDLRAWAAEHGELPEPFVEDEITTLAGVLPGWMTCAPEDLDPDEGRPT